MADAVELDPVGVRAASRSRKRAAADGHGSSLSAVPHTTRTGQAIRSASRLPARRAARTRSARRAPSQAAAPRSWWASSSAGMCSKFVVDERVARRRPSARGERSRRRAARPPAPAPASSRSSRASPGTTRRPPPSRRPARARRPTARARARRAAAPRSRRASCRRCARSRSPPRPSRARPRRRRRASRRPRPSSGGPPACPASVGREHVVLALERRQHELPRPPRVGEAVQAAPAAGRSRRGATG